MRLDIRFRPLPVWPYPVTRERRWRPFSAGWDSTLSLLQRELDHLDARNALIGAALREDDIRMDGLPRSAAPIPPHPGVEVSFDSRHGRLVYATDVCARYQDNVRSIALGLDSLRAVDRYGITRRGEQYAGWKALPGTSMSQDAAPSSDGEAWAILCGAADVRPADARTDASLVDDVERLYRRAVKRSHPDAGGDPAVFRRVQAAKAFLLQRGAA